MSNRTMSTNGRPDRPAASSVPLGLTKTVVRRAVDILLGGIVTYLLGAASGFIRTNWHIVTAAVLLCLAFLINGLMRWTGAGLRQSNGMSGLAVIVATE
jgi:hypothetical protein